MHEGYFLAKERHVLTRFGEIVWPVQTVNVVSFLDRQSYVESRDASILVHSCYPEGEMDEEMDEILNSKPANEDQVSR